VVSVAAGGGGTPIRPVKVEGTYTPPAYLLADASGRLHTAGAERRRPDLGMAIADVRDILGYPQIVVAGATWPAELVFHARMYNPLAAIGAFLRGKPEVIALPFPDGWPDERVELYAELVEKLDVVVEPLPESVALSGYVRALGLVRPPDARDPRGIGATGVYSDGRTMLVVAVHGDDEQPTESIEVPVTAEAMRDARSADNVVIEVMAAARSIGADTSTVLLSGNACFNEALRLAFQNHLGHRLHVAAHPMHALVLGATHLLVTESEDEEPPGAAPGPRYPAEPMRPAPVDQRPPPAPPHPQQAPGSPMVTYGPGYPSAPPSPGTASSEAPTTRVTRAEPVRGAHGGQDKGRLFPALKDNLFGVPAVLGAMALAVVVAPGDVGSMPGAGPVAQTVTLVQDSCEETSRIERERSRQGIATVRGASADTTCARPNMDTLRYVVPGPPGAVDPGPPVRI